MKYIENAISKEEQIRLKIFKKKEKETDFQECVGQY